MYRFEDLRLRRFQFEDIPLKIKWINQDENNRYLGYDLPLEYEKTCRWFEGVKDREDRYDFVVEYQGRPVGLTGLVNVDTKNRKAGNYILTGELGYKGRGIGYRAGLLNFLYGFEVLGLNKLCGDIEVGNVASLKRCRRLCGHVEGYLMDERWRDGKPVDVYRVAYYKSEFTMPEGVYWEADPLMDCHNLEIGGGVTPPDRNVCSCLFLFMPPRRGGTAYGKGEDERVPV